MILKNCRLIPELCEGFEGERADIRVEGDIIAEFLPAGGSYTGEEVIDCTDKTVMPGLFDVHTHLWFRDFAYMAENMMQHTQYEHYSDSIRFMYTLLGYGYTSIRDAGSGYNLCVQLRNSINSGAMIGPDIKASGLLLCPDFQIFPNPYSNVYGMPVNSPMAMRAAVRKILSEGNDFIKIYGCDAYPDGRRGTAPLFYPDEMEELANTCKRENVYFAVHTVGEDSIDCAIDYGAGSIEHACGFTQKNMDNLIKHGYKSSIVPTLWNSTFSGAYAPSFVEQFIKGFNMIYEDKNILIGFGTDDTEEVFKKFPANEFLCRNEGLGWSKIDILKQATINSAKINGTDALRGSLKAGKKADIIVIDGKPDEDLHVFAKPPVYVLKDGAVVAQNGFVKVNLM